MYLCTAQALVVMKVLVCGVLTMIMMVPEVLCSGLALVFCDQPGRSGRFWSAVLSLLLFIWLHPQLSAVPGRRADVLYGVVVLVFGAFGALRNHLGL